MRDKYLETVRHWNLQLFADDGGTDAGSNPDQGSNSDHDKAAEAEGEEAGKKTAKEASKNNKPEAKYTDDELDRILSKKFAAWQKKKETEVNEAKKLASMSQEQRTTHEIQQLKEELAGYKKANTLNEMGKTARGILSEKGITASDELVNILVSDDAETTQKAVDSFAKLFQTAVERAVKDKLKGEPPKAGKAKSGMTKDQIMAIKDPAARKKAIAENMDLFSK